LQPLIPKWREMGVHFILVAQEERSTARFLDNHGLETRVLLDRTGNVAGAYGVVAIPHTFWIDRQGIVRHASIGWRKEKVKEYDDLAAELAR